MRDGNVEAPPSPDKDGLTPEERQRRVWLCLQGLVLKHARRHPGCRTPSTCWYLRELLVARAGMPRWLADAFITAGVQQPKSTEAGGR
jgi:hypothetical protein